MKRRSYGFRASAVLLALAMAGLGQVEAQTPVAPAMLDATVSRLVLAAFDRPEESLQELRALASQPAHAERLDLLRQAEAQALIELGDLPPAQAIAEDFALQARTRVQGLMLRALIAERSGQTTAASTLAQQALDGLQAHCLPGEELSSIAQGCDFRTAWQALRVLTREQRNQGTLAKADVSARRALALAKAGQDSQLIAISQATLALVVQKQDETAEANRLMSAALETARGDTQALLWVRLYQSSVLGARGDHEARRDVLEAVLQAAQKAGAIHLVAQAQNNLTDYYLHKQQPARALSYALLALPVQIRFKDLRIERILRHNMAVAQIYLRQFDAARQSQVRVDTLRRGQDDLAVRVTEMRELGEAWSAVGQPREAIQAFHTERELNAQANAKNRESALQELKSKYGSDARQRDLELLKRDKVLKDQQLDNRQLAQQVGFAAAVLLGLSLVLVVLMVRRVREANKRLKANQLLLRAQSERDPLTDLANRRHFLAVMAQHAQAQIDGALLMVDIDHFKRINDERGHSAGDAVICEVARRLSHAVRAEDLVVRWGGEEFLVYAPGVGQEQLAVLAERILSSIGALDVATEDAPLRVTASIGFAHFPLPPTGLHLHWEQAVNWADMALYTAKAHGRNRAVGIAAVDATDLQGLLDIEADFDAACTARRVTLLHVTGPQR